jgi:hypothetical protein
MTASDADGGYTTDKNDQARLSLLDDLKKQKQNDTHVNQRFP